MAGAFAGMIFYNALSISPPTAAIGTTAGLYSLIRNGAGSWSWNQTSGAAVTTVFLADDANISRPYNTFNAFPGQGTVPTSNEWLEAFGTAAGGPGQPFSGTAAGSTTTAGTIQTTQFGTPQLPWGLALVDVFVVYSVSTAALTAATLTVTRNIYSENTAIGQTTTLAATAIALTTTTSGSTPHVQKVSLAQPITYESVDYSYLSLELSLTTAATSIVQVFGMGAHYVIKYI